MSTNEVATQESYVPRRAFDFPGTVTATGLVFEEDLTFERWQSIGRTLGRIDAASAWWIGDWVNYGEAQFGEKYSQAMEDTGLEYQTLANYAWVAKSIAPEKRRADLSWSHHALVASDKVPAKQKELFLDHAAAGGWTTRELKGELKRIGKGKGEKAEEPDPNVCPTCHRPYDQPGEGS